MALDAAMLEAVTTDASPATIRVYSWAKPIVTVGRLQDFSEARRSFPNATLVRRQTGGKAVLHGDDLTVSIAAPEREVLHGKAGRGVLATHNVLVGAVERAYADFGIRAGCGPSAIGKRAVDGNCFALTARCDLRDLVTGLKLLGSAQLRQKGIILQQMSLRSHQLVNVASADFSKCLQRCMAEALEIAAWRLEPLSDTEELTASRLMESWQVEA
jgi:lipoate-protein ligase A